MVKYDNDDSSEDFLEDKPKTMKAVRTINKTVGKKRTSTPVKIAATAATTPPTIASKIAASVPSWVSMHYPTIKPLNPAHPDAKKIKAAAVPKIGGEHHFVYLIQEREFLKSGEPVYKIGKTTQPPNTRLAGYPKGSRIVLYADVSFSGCHYMEKILIGEFDRLYIHRADIGRESYEGDLERMKATFFRVVRETDRLSETPTGGPGTFLWRLLIRTWRFVRS
jgi:hypothetical protein